MQIFFLLKKINIDHDADEPIRVSGRTSSNTLDGESFLRVPMFLF